MDLEKNSKKNSGWHLSKNGFPHVETQKISYQTGQLKWSWDTYNENFSTDHQKIIYFSEKSYYGPRKKFEKKILVDI